jgi:hypothetical protein
LARSLHFGLNTHHSWIRLPLLAMCAFGACRTFDNPNADGNPDAERGGAPPSGHLSGAPGDGQPGGDAAGGGGLGGIAGDMTSASGDRSTSAGASGSPSAPELVGAAAPGVPLDPAAFETYGLGYYASYMGTGNLCPQQAGILYCNVFGQAGSRPYVVGSPAPCRTHSEATEFAGFGVVYAGSWHTSLGDFYWTWGLDEKYDGRQGGTPWPAVWNGVLVAFEVTIEGDDVHAKFSVDWQRHFWRSSTGVVVLDFTPESLSADLPAYPVIGRWRRDHGQRLGLYQGGTFYLDWDGDNAWNAEHDRLLNFLAPGDYPVAADFWAGGGDEVALYKDGTWYIDANQNGTWDGEEGGDVVASFGTVGSLPVVSRDGWTRDCE